MSITRVGRRSRWRRHGLLLALIWLLTPLVGAGALPLRSILAAAPATSSPTYCDPLQEPPSDWRPSIALADPLKATNRDPLDWFGYSVASDGDTIVVGAPREDSAGPPDDDNALQAGAAYVYVRANGAWTQQAYLKAANAQEADRFGESVAILGDTIVVGAPGEDGDGTSPDNNAMRDSGAAYVFVRQQGVWTQQAYLKAPETRIAQEFGSSVALDGDTLVVGAAAPAFARSGAVSVFVSRRIMGVTTWLHQAELSAFNSTARNLFGFSLDLTGDTLVVGAPGESSDGSDPATTSEPYSGAVYVFVRSGTTWGLRAHLKAPNLDEGDIFGGAVAIDGDLLAIAAPLEAGNGSSPANNSADESGAVYVFGRSATQTPPAWTFRAYLKAANPGCSDYFGRSLAVVGDAIVVGASREASNGGSSADNSAPYAGAVYVFGPLKGQNPLWQQRRYIKAPKVQPFAEFGHSLAIAGDTILVGAIGEDTAGANPADKGILDTGAIYMAPLRFYGYLPRITRP